MTHKISRNKLWIVDTLSLLKLKPYRTEPELIWMKWATARIEELKTNGETMLDALL